MRPELLPAHPLSQVVFVHDYLQLVFQNEIFTIYNTAEVSEADHSHVQGQPGFADALIGLIEKRATSVVSRTKYSLQIEFQNGATVNVLRTAANAAGPEAWQFRSLGGPVVVEANE